MAAFQRVLIANRGEIAVRIAKAAAALEIDSVAVFAPADALALHTRLAGSAVELTGGPDPQRDPVGAHLDARCLIDIARQHGCDCVHPGYGFLAENASFAEWCEAEGLTFIGPPPEALALFGDKIRSRALARSLGIPVVAGSAEPLLSAAEAARLADHVGYPVMLKAASGGGGRGMRVVAGAADMAEAFERCRGEAAAAFGDGTLFLEHLVVRPRHIEVQVLADGEGNVVHLHERDCSVQQRNQKVVEIAPAANLADELRRHLTDDAVRLVRAAGYR